MFITACNKFLSIFNLVQLMFLLDVKVAAASLNGFNVGGFMLVVCSVASYTSKELLATNF